MTLQKSITLLVAAVWLGAANFGAAPAAPVPAVPTAPPATVPATQPAEKLQLVWADEFNKDGPLDPKDWNFEQGFRRNQELQWYQPENAICKDGFLVIEARRKTNMPNPTYVAGSTQWQTSRKNIEYTAASVTTSRKHAWLYGRFEIRARINTNSGSWPAFWMLGTRGGWPAGGEIDIMEYYRNMLLANIAWASPTNAAVWNSVRTPMSKLPKDWSSQFHIWRMDWDADFVKMYCDDKLLNTQDLSKTLNGGRAGDNPFHHPQYILLNQAIGGQNGGDPSKTEFPLRYEIDYVRVYQTPSQIAATAAAATQPQPANPTGFGRRGRRGATTQPAASQPSTKPAA